VRQSVKCSTPVRGRQVKGPNVDVSGPRAEKSLFFTVFTRSLPQTHSFGTLKEKTRAACGTFGELLSRERQPGGTGIVNKTGGYVGPAREGRPSHSEIQRGPDDDGTIKLLVRQQGDVRVVKSVARSQCNLAFPRSHTVWPFFIDIATIDPSLAAARGGRRAVGRWELSRHFTDRRQSRLLSSQIADKSQLNWKQMNPS